MKKLIIILFGTLIFSCNENKKEQTQIKQVEIENNNTNFDWLIGKWKRLGEEKGKETFENWTKISETEYSGIGFTMQNNDTIKQESIKLKKSHEKWNLFVKTPEETERTVFEMKEHNTNQFTCENNEIDFPNKIKYWKSGNNIKATVSNSEVEIQFEFEKINE